MLGASGGVGLTAVEIGKALGARVIAAASSPDKLALCREHGADELIDYSADDLKARLADEAPGGIDVVYDPSVATMRRRRCARCAGVEGISRSDTRPVTSPRWG